MSICPFNLLSKVRRFLYIIVGLQFTFDVRGPAMYRIIDAEGNTIQEAETSLWLVFMNLHRRHRVHWGDHYRVMKRRRDPESLVLKCKDCGHQLRDEDQ